MAVSGVVGGSGEDRDQAAADRAELIAINKILVALDLIEIGLNGGYDPGIAAFARGPVVEDAGAKSREIPPHQLRELPHRQLPGFHHQSALAKNPRHSAQAVENTLQQRLDESPLGAAGTELTTGAAAGENGARLLAIAPDREKW